MLVALCSKLKKVCPNKEGAVGCGVWFREISSVYIWKDGDGTIRPSAFGSNCEKGTSESTQAITAHALTDTNYMV